MKNFKIEKYCTKVTKKELEEIQKENFIDGNVLYKVEEFETLVDAKNAFENYEASLSSSWCGSGYTAFKTLIGYELIEYDSDGHFVASHDEKRAY